MAATLKKNNQKGCKKFLPIAPLFLKIFSKKQNTSEKFLR
jgi:hypothetical protein